MNDLVLPYSLTVGALVPIAALAMASDASWAVTVSEDGTIRTLGTGVGPRVLRRAVPIDGRQPVAVALFANRLIRVIWASGDRLALFENERGAWPRKEVFAAPAPVRAVAFSPSGRIAVVACTDGTLTSLDVATGESGRKLVAGVALTRALAVASDEGPVVAYLGDGSVRRFDLRTGIPHVVGTDLAVSHVAITPDGNMVLALGADGILRRWNMSLGGPPDLLDLDGAITALAVGGTGDKLLAGMSDGRLWLRDLTGGSAAEFGQAGKSFPSAREPSILAVSATQAQAPPDSGRIVDNDVGFTVYRPRYLTPETWASLLVFAHKTDPVVDPALGPIDPNEVVEARAREHFGPSVPPPARVDSRRGLFRGARLRIAPDLPGILCNPAEAELYWWEPVHEVRFRLFAKPELVGAAVRGAVRVWFGPLLIGEVSLTIGVRASAPDDQSVADWAPRYQKIFPCYSHLDHAIVEGFDDAVRALGGQYLRDVLALRAGEHWQPRLLELIREADVFQLFWSSNSMRSRYCQQEWEHALALRRPSFVRPLYWEDPLPQDPAQGLPPVVLRELHFVKVHSAPAGPVPGEADRLEAGEFEYEPAGHGADCSDLTARLPRPDAGTAWRDEIGTGPSPRTTAAGSALVVNTGGTSHLVRAGSRYRVGRDPRSDIVLTDTRVSWHHAVFRADHGVWFVEDAGSTNGTYIGSRRISRYEISRECKFQFGSPIDGPGVTCWPAREHGRSRTRAETPSPSGQAYLQGPAPPAAVAPRPASPPRPSAQAAPNPRADAPRAAGWAPTGAQQASRGDAPPAPYASVPGGAAKGPRPTARARPPFLRRTGVNVAAAALLIVIAVIVAILILR